MNVKMKEEDRNIMENNEILELEDGIKYITIMSIIHEDKEYVLATEINDEETEMSDEADIFIRDRENSIVKQIEDEFEYNLVKEVFERKLSQE